MKLTHALFLTSLTVALNFAISASAADEKPAKEVKIEKAQPAKKAEPRSDSAAQNKQKTDGKAEDMCCRQSSQPSKKSGHDHH